jgi:HEAT repeat protein
MPFVKRGSAELPGTPQAASDLASLLESLGSADPNARWRAARALGGNVEAVASLAEALAKEQVPRVFEALVTGLMRAGNTESVAALLPYLRSSDASRRAQCIEALQALPDATTPFIATLLRDDDSDVRILAIELVRGMPAATATRLLCDMLDSEQHPNVCGAAVDVLAEAGTRDALPMLEACAQRFAGTPFLPFALSTAIARIADAEGS